MGEAKLKGKITRIATKAYNLKSQGLCRVLEYGPILIIKVGGRTHKIRLEYMKAYPVEVLLTIIGEVKGSQIIEEIEARECKCEWIKKHKGYEDEVIFLYKQYFH